MEDHLRPRPIHHLPGTRVHNGIAGTLYIPIYYQRNATGSLLPKGQIHSPMLQSSGKSLGRGKSVPHGGRGPRALLQSWTKPQGRNPHRPSASSPPSPARRPSALLPVSSSPWLLVYPCNVKQWCHLELAFFQRTGGKVPESDDTPLCL